MLGAPQNGCFPVRAASPALHDRWMAPTPIVASDLPAIVLVVAATVFVVVVVIGMHVWGAIQDGREEKAFREKQRGGPVDPDRRDR